MTAWEVTVEDINVVLAFHGVMMPEKQVYELLDELDADAITDDLSSYEEFGDQCMSVLSEVEDQLIDLGVVDSDKLFEKSDS